LNDQHTYHTSFAALFAYRLSLVKLSLSHIDKLLATTSGELAWLRARSV